MFSAFLCSIGHASSSFCLLLLKGCSLILLLNHIHKLLSENFPYETYEKLPLIVISLCLYLAKGFCSWMRFRCNKDLHIHHNQSFPKEMLGLILYLGIEEIQGLLLCVLFFHKGFYKQDGELLKVHLNGLQNKKLSL